MKIPVLITKDSYSKKNNNKTPGKNVVHFIFHTETIHLAHILFTGILEIPSYFKVQDLLAITVCRSHVLQQSWISPCARILFYKQALNTVGTAETFIHNKRHSVVTTQIARWTNAALNSPWLIFVKHK